MTERLVTVECVDCEREFVNGTGEGWAFDRVPWNATIRAVVQKHEARYGHKVRVIR